MWDGYLDRKKPTFKESLYNFLKPYKIEYMHTSGHADLGTLKTVLKQLNPNAALYLFTQKHLKNFKNYFMNRLLLFLFMMEMYLM